MIDGEKDGESYEEVSGGEFTKEGVEMGRGGGGKEGRAECELVELEIFLLVK